MAVVWGLIVAASLITLLLKSNAAGKRVDSLERDLADLRAGMAKDWTQRRTVNEDVQGRLTALEAGGPRALPAEVAQPPLAVAAAAPSAEPRAPVEATPSPPPAPQPSADEAPRPAIPQLPGTEPTEAPAPLQAAPPVYVTPPRPTPPPPPKRPAINLEEWLGVKGAAVGGGIIACLAAVMFFQHAIESNWISPTLRVVMGTLAGIAAIGAAQTSKLRRYTITANAVAGAGLVALYASFWASHALYDLVGKYPVGGLMALVTAACCALAIRHGSVQIALLGLAGGFATPLLLSSGSDKPIELFGYLLLLDLAFLYLAQKKDWPVLGILSLLGTLLFQVLWMGDRMGGERVWLGVCILAVFAVVFAAAGKRAEGETKDVWNITTAAAMLFPLVFGIYFAARSGLNADPGPIFAMVVFVTAGAGWLGRDPAQRLLPLGAAAGGLGVLTTFLLMGQSVPHQLYWGAGVASVLAVLQHGFIEWRSRTEPEPGALTVLPGTVAGVGGAVVLLIAQYADGFVAGQWAAGIGATALLGGLLLRQQSLRGTGARFTSAAAGMAMGLAVAEGLMHHRTGPAASLSTHLAAVFGIGAALQFWALRGARVPARRAAEIGAALFAAVCLFGLATSPWLSELPAVVTGLALTGMAVLVAMAATRIDAGGWYLTASALGAFAYSLLVESRAPGKSEAEVAVLVLLVLTFALFTWWPVFTTRRFRTGRWAWYGAALAGPMFFPAARQLWESLLGDGMTGVLAVGFAAVSVGALAKAQSQWDKSDPVRTSVLAWLGAAALFFISLAIPLQLERSWWTIGWALEGLAVLALWKKVDHPGLKWLAMGLFGAVSARLLLNPEVLTYYDRGSWRIVNWLAYTYLVPAAALVGGAVLLGPLEAKRARPWERFLYATPVTLSSVLGLLGVLVGFAWINLAVLDWFAEGYTLTVSLERMPARDLSFSIAWAVYAVMLLAVGMARRIKGLRYLSLGLLIITIGKAFLYDLGHLEDLYRVASLVGLAVSLFLVSMAYQRFVFTKDGGELAPEPAPDKETP